MNYTIYTDGSCRGNPGRGGWGFVILRGEEKVYEGSGSIRSTSNNRMELTAAIRGLGCLWDVLPEEERKTAKIVLRSDSQYVVRGVTEWVPGWERQGWAKADGSPVKNLDLWQNLMRLIRFAQPHLEWVRGHDGDEWNEYCDGLATKASGEEI